jgi:outer membrane murein-binding lipoprotein Lpp
MKSPFKYLVLFVVVGGLILSACGSSASAPVSEPQEIYAEAPAMEAPAAVEEFSAPQPGAESMSKSDGYAGGENIVMATAMPLEGEVAPIDAPNRAGRMIIKNAEIRLLVEDTDIAINLATQAIGDVGGYIVSSRVWYQAHYDGKNYKYASITIGVPVSEFERMLNKLRGTAVQVLDETATGEDVSDQFVDLQSQVTNLEATRERIKSFLDDAKTVDEALRINQELANVEAQIEQLKGQMNYLQDRSAYSTITVTFEPKLPELATPTPVPTITPEAWNPGETFGKAKESVTYAYQGIVDFLIWVVVFLLPIFAPPILVIWLLWKWLRGKVK